MLKFTAHTSRHVSHYVHPGLIIDTVLAILFELWCVHGRSTLHNYCSKKKKNKNKILANCRKDVIPFLNAF